jgi:hypothetical protein
MRGSTAQLEPGGNLARDPVYRLVGLLLGGRAAVALEESDEAGVQGAVALARPIAVRVERREQLLERVACELPWLPTSSLPTRTRVWEGRGRCYGKTVSASI